MQGLVEPELEASPKREPRQRADGAGAEVAPRGRQARALSSVERLLEAVKANVTLGVASGSVFALVDSARRLKNDDLALLHHVRGVLALYAVVGAALGLASAVVMSLEHAVHDRIARRRPRLALGARAALYALLAAVIVRSTAFWTFTGGRVQSTSVAKWGPWAVLAAVACGIVSLSLLTTSAARARRQHKVLWPLVATLLGFSVAALAIYLNLTVYVALYARLHTVVEVAAAVALMCAGGSVLHDWLARGSGRRLGTAVAVGGLAWLLVYVAWERPRTWLDRELRHTWLEPIYAGRMLARVQALDAYLSNPSAWKGVGYWGIDRLKEQYDLGSTRLAPTWELPAKDAPKAAKGLTALRAGKRPNVLVYYVDTLRADVAADARVMPNLAQLNRQSVQFMRSYAAGSDTARSLPALTSGRYTRKADHPDFIEVARRHGYQTALVIPQSAQEFLDKEVKSFRFDETLQVLDYAAVRTDVWGYGADRPSAAKIVDQLLDWLPGHRSRPFLAWAFNFDLHNWREISDEFVTESAIKYDMPVESGRPRYEVVARSIDNELGRLLAGLDKLGLADDTIVVFVSDHGEALGRDGFWVHSIFLWEPLVRVPLTLRIPGVAPKQVFEPVSLVDVAPTLGRYFDSKLELTGYHGADLLGYLSAEPPPRRPIVMEGGTWDSIRRIGIVDAKTPYKLVVQLEAGIPELYELAGEDPDSFSVADARPGETMSLLNDLVRSPLFPRSAEEAH